MKKIFTLLTMALLVIGVQAQTTYSLAGKTIADFTLGNDFITGENWTSDGSIGTNGTEYVTINYNTTSSSTWSDLVLTGTPVVFQYKNSSKKAQFYRLFDDFFYANGKPSRITVKGLTKGNIVTLKVAGKNDTGCMFESITNCTADASNPTSAVKKTTDVSQFSSFKFIASADGDITVAETSSGYLLASVTIEEGSGDVPETPLAADGKHIIYFANDVATGEILTFGGTLNGFKLEMVTDAEKSFSSGSNITIDSKTYKSIKNSAGIQNKLTLPEGKVAKGIKFYSFVNKKTADATNDSYWNEVAGTEFTAATAGGNMACFSDGDLSSPDVREFSFGDGRLNEITFNNAGHQLAFAIEIEIETGSVVTPATVTYVSDEPVTPAEPHAATVWDFTKTTVELLNPAYWTEDTSNPGRYTYGAEIESDNYKDLGELGCSEGLGLLVGRSGNKLAANSIRVDVGKQIQINASNGVYKITDLAKDDVIRIRYKNASKDEARTFTVTNGDVASLSAPMTDEDNTEKEATITVAADGDLLLKQSKAINVYAITVNAALPEVTGISTINAETVNDAVIYNLSGQRVDENYRGVVIKNGKKVVIK